MDLLLGKPFPHVPMDFALLLDQSMTLFSGKGKEGKGA